MRLIAIIIIALAMSTYGLVDDGYKRLDPGQYMKELKSSGSPEIPFKNFSSAYVKKALSTHVNWTALGAVTPVKDQGPHGYCGTFGRVASAEGQYAIKLGNLGSPAPFRLRPPTLPQRRRRPFWGFGSFFSK